MKSIQSSYTRTHTHVTHTDKTDLTTNLILDTANRLINSQIGKIF